jgi:hypothetical protein
MARAMADRITASRGMGRPAPEKDWVTPMLTSEAELHQHVRRGVVRVETENPTAPRRG